MNSLFIGVFVLSLWGFPQHLEARIPPEPHPIAQILPQVDTSTPEGIKQRITYYSGLYGVSSTTMRAIVNCESGFNKDANGDNGTSHGLVQIHKVPGVHEDITHEQAHSVEFALNFLAENLKEGNGKIWSCFKNR